MKKFSKVAIVFLILTAMVLSVAACSSVRSVEISNENMPQLVFVQGEDIDLSSGKLTVNSKKGSQEVALNASGVNVAGYDKNTLGEQTLTISYQGKSTSLTVNVVARMVAENIEANYFVNQAFDTSKGRLRITRNDGTSFTVPMNDAALTIDFDSTAAATPCMVKAKYQEYEGSFAVNVYAIGEARLTRPSKTAYKSHEESIDLAGGYLTLKNGTTEKYVALTADMISGFDLSAADETNRETPLEQTVSVDYAGKHFEYKVRITYSDVSYIKQKAQELASINWNGTALPTISKEAGDKALDAMSLYLTLSDEEKILVSVGEQANVARAAAVYGYAQWKEEVAKHNKTFSILKDDESSLEYMSFMPDVVYADAAADFGQLQDTNQAIYTDAALLQAIMHAYEGNTLFGDVTVDGYLHAVTDLDAAVDALGFMVNLYDSLKDVVSWTMDTVSNIDVIDDALQIIEEKPYTSKALYNLVASWRESTIAEFFDMLYSYCYKTEDILHANLLKYMYLPTGISGVYTNIMLSMKMVNYIADSTVFMYAYNNAVTLETDLLANGSDLNKWLYRHLTITGTFTMGTCVTYLRRAGYEEMSGAMLGVAAYEDMWAAYLAVVDKYFTDETYEEGTQFGADVEALFTQFMALTPTQQYGFIASLNDNYYSSAENVFMLAWDLDRDKNSPPMLLFVTWIVNHYEEKLSDEGFVVFEDLMYAAECYWLRYSINNATLIFNNLMKEVVEAKYDALNEADKTVLQSIYSYYSNIYNYINLNKEEHPPLTAEEIEILNALYLPMQQALLAITRSSSSNYYRLTNLVITAYEKAERIAAEILGGQNTNIIRSYYHDTYVFLQRYNWSFDYAMHFLRSYYVGYLRAYPSNSNSLSLWEDYVASGQMQPFMTQVYDIVWKFYINTISEEQTAYNETDVLNTMKAFRNLDTYDRLMFLIMESSCYFFPNPTENGYTNFYYGGLMQFFRQVLTEESTPDDNQGVEAQDDGESYTLVDLANALITLERNYVFYVNYKDVEAAEEQYRAALQNAKANVDKIHAALNLTGEQQTAYNTYLKEMHDYYNAAVTVLNLPSIETEDGADAAMAA